jgi:hypothetical protein
MTSTRRAKLAKAILKIIGHAINFFLIPLIDAGNRDLFSKAHPNAGINRNNCEMIVPRGRKSETMVNSTPIVASPQKQVMQKP